ncbi:tetratricopeptide repeat protein 39B-like [Aricia agestis]|uniref:tetratricopeptide repeat protein 39B-like n=1 Tax=Aricia agestis TaxID=91739 RepID=UPI001C20B4B1|nr:tetratricopeptide repeat protein 39B-like [Aricia agestis]
MTKMREVPTDNDSSLEGSIVEDDDSDTFHDALEQQPVMDLHRALSDCSVAIKKFFSNDIAGAEAIMTPWKGTSLYHAHGAAIFEFVPAVLTMDPYQVHRARLALQHTLSLYAKEKLSSSFSQTLSSIVKKHNYAAYTDMQAHAELINAECQLIIACIGALESEDMAGVIRVSMRIRSAFTSYKYCAKLLEHRQWENDQSRWHFSSGVKLGLGTFNVMIAMLPPKLISVLEFVGFTANKEVGLDELLEASDLPGLRSVLCRMTVLAYHLVIANFASVPPDLVVTQKLLKSSLELYPGSVWFLLFKGRIELMTGMIDESVKTYRIVAEHSLLWKQIQHLACWEIMWAECLMLNWNNCLSSVDVLVRDSKWSTTIYMYLRAAILMEIDDDGRDATGVIAAMIMGAPSHRRRIMGRSVPMEKFIERRCNQWRQKGYLILPAIEMACLWNLFPALAKDTHYADTMLRKIERVYNKIEAAEDPHYIPGPGRHNYDVEDKAVISFLRGSLLTAMKLPRLALRFLDDVIDLKDRIKDNKYVVPFAVVDAATCYFDMGEPSFAIHMLNEARRKYSNFVLDSRLLFRIHGKLNTIRAYQESLKSSTKPESALEAVETPAQIQNLSKAKRVLGIETDV